MRYLLVIGFTCNVYRREPQARIFVGNKLIDEFNIKHFNYKKKYYGENIRFLPRDQNIYEKLRCEDIPNISRFYEIDIDKHQEKLDIVVSIKNDDNNYINGFMSKTTTIELNHFLFFPLDKKLLHRLNIIQKKKIISKNIAWYYQKQYMFELLTSCIWQNKDKNSLLEFNLTNFSKSDVTLGGSGYFIDTLVKKYGFFINKNKKFFICKFSYYIIDYFFNKYMEYANQRNTD